MSKYGNRKVRVDDKIFDSRKEARRYVNLCLLLKAGEITDLQTQVTFNLIPAQYEECNEVYTKGIHKGEKKRGKLLERGVDYVADFVFKTKDGKTIVEDVKGYRTKEYKIKKKLMLFIHKIHIREI